MSRQRAEVKAGAIEGGHDFGALVAGENVHVTAEAISIKPKRHIPQMQ